MGVIMGITKIWYYNRRLTKCLSSLNYTPSQEWGLKSVAKKRPQGYLCPCNKTSNIKRVIISLPISSPQEQFESLWHPKSHKSTMLLLDSYALSHEFSRYVLPVHMIPEREKQVIEKMKKCNNHRGKEKINQWGLKVCWFILLKAFKSFVPKYELCVRKNINSTWDVSQQKSLENVSKESLPF